MIVGIGTDLIEIERVVNACKKGNFTKRIYTVAERALFERDEKKAATNFAAKEALVKALGVGFGAVKPCDVEVLRDDAGKPFINLYGEAGRLFDAAEGSRIHVSLTHSKKYASAYVVLEA